MSIYAHIENGIIVNTAICDNPEFASTQGWVLLDGIDPQPCVGWITNDNGQTFMPPSPPATTPQQQARNNLQAMFTQVPAMSEQITTDSALFANTPVGSTLTAEHLAALERVVNGFTTVLNAMQEHAVFTGAIDASA